MLKRLFAVIMLVSVAASLSACGTKGESDYPGGKNVPGRAGKSDNRNWVK
jgi:predicted small lipoprotein YifL